MKTLPGELETLPFIIKYWNIFTASILYATQTTCARTDTRCGNRNIYVPQKRDRLIYWSTAAVVGAVLKSKQYDHMTSPFLRL